MATRETPRQRRRPSLNRRILFYGYDRGKDAAGRPVPFDARSAFEFVAGLPWTEQGKYLQVKAEELAYCEGELRNGVIEASIGLSRRGDWPLNERDGRLSELNLPPDSGLAELSHMVFFVGDSIAGVEYNHRGARVSSTVPAYFREKTPQIADGLRFYELLRNDVEQDLRRLGSISLFRMRLYNSHLEEAAAVDATLSDALRRAVRAGQAQDVEIILRKGDASFSERIMQWARSVARRPRRQEEFVSVELKGKDVETNKTRPVNVLRDTLVFEADIERRGERSKAVDPAAAFRHIETIYRQNREALLNAKLLEYV